MTNPTPLDLGRRERQIMEIVYAKGEASVTDVLEALADPPSYSAVRAMLNLLEEKGHLRRKAAGRKFLYIPTVPRNKARRVAIRNLLHTFFGGSVNEAIASMIDQEKLSHDDLDRLSKLIDAAKKEGR